MELFFNISLCLLDSQLFIFQRKRIQNDLFNDIPNLRAIKAVSYDIKI